MMSGAVCVRVAGGREGGGRGWRWGARGVEGGGDGAWVGGGVRVDAVGGGGCMDWGGEMGRAVGCGEVVVADLVVPDGDPRAGRCSKVRCPRVHRRRCDGGGGGTSEAAAQEQQQAEGLEQWKQPDEERRASDSEQRQSAPRGGTDAERGKITSGDARGCESRRVVAEGGHCRCVCV